MVFVMGSCYLLHSPIHPCLFSVPSSSLSACIFSPLRVARNGRKYGRVSASMEQETKKERTSCARRVILFVGLSVLPVLKMTAMPLQSLAADGSDLKASELDQRPEVKSMFSQKGHQGAASGNPFVSVLSGLGILGSGVLTALYALALKEKETSESTIELIRGQLKEKEATIISMKKKFESDLMHEKEVRTQEVMRVRAEQQSSINQLKSANDAIVGLRQELQKESKVVQELKVSNDNLQNKLAKAGEDNKELREKLKEKRDSLGVLQEKINFLTGEMKEKDDHLLTLNSALADKETQLQKLSTENQQLQDQLAGLSSENEGLKEKLLRNAKELEEKVVAVDALNAQVGELLAEKDKSTRKIDSIQREYNNLKSSSEKKAAEYAKLFEDQVHSLHQIKEQLESTSSELGQSKELVTDLTQEREDLRKMLDVELNNVKSLQQELHTKHENLEKSKIQVSELAKQLQQSRDLCFNLEAEVSKVRADFTETRESLQGIAEEAKRSVKLLAGELTSLKELLKKETEEKDRISQELTSVTQWRDDLQKELVDVFAKAETAASQVHEEKATVDSLKKELKAFETQVSKEIEGRKSLEKDLEETSRSLDEMNQNASILSKELELANTQISSIEDEKDALYKSLAEQKQISQEARENMEDAHSLIMRLGQEKESIEKRTKKLEDELASAKGEILRLRSQINSSKTVVNDQHQQKEKVEVGTKAAAPAKRARRRRKTVAQEDDS